jgi:methionine sulfoxide reductase heme-binding subunit
MTTWIFLRAAGIASYLMLFGSVLWGLIATTGVIRKRVAKATSTFVHQVLSTAGFVFLALHLSGLLIDTFEPFGFLDVLVPGHASYRTVGVGLGVAAMYLTVIVLVSSWIRRGIGPAWWRRLHVLAVPAFSLSMVHGVLAGSDSLSPWMWGMYSSSGMMVVSLLVVRALGSRTKVQPRAKVPVAGGRSALVTESRST